MFVTDRTESDVIKKTDKGVYSYNDLNRVEEAVRTISDLFPSLDIQFTMDTKTDWYFPGDYNYSLWPTEEQMARYLYNVALLRDLFLVEERLPQSMRRLTWQGANNIEKVLEKAFIRANGAVDSFWYSGEFFAGEV